MLNDLKLLVAWKGALLPSKLMCQVMKKCDSHGEDINGLREVWQLSGSVTIY